MKHRSWCSRHYQKWQRYGDPEKGRENKTKNDPERFCSVMGCEGKWYSRVGQDGPGYCVMHYGRVKKNGKPGPPGRLIGERGKGYKNQHGYMLAQQNGKTKMVHRIIMEDILGRSLFPDETVHHKNGNRSDNRTENLELWSSKHPKGQQIKDKLEFAREMIERYRTT